MAPAARQPPGVRPGFGLGVTGHLDYSLTPQRDSSIPLPARSAPSAADVGHLDARELGRRRRALLRVAVGAPAPDPADRRVQLRVVGAAAQERAQVVAPGGEQAGVEASLGRDPRARAVAAERLGDRGDDADLAAAVAVAPAPRDLAAVVLLGRLERELGVDRAPRSRPPGRRRRGASRSWRRRPCTR